MTIYGNKSVKLKTVIIVRLIVMISEILLVENFCTQKTDAVQDGGK
jgi:hypothetical protein